MCIVFLGYYVNCVQFKRSGPSCSELTMLLANNMLNSQMYCTPKHCRILPKKCEEHLAQKYCHYLLKKM